VVRDCVGGAFAGITITHCFRGARPECRRVRVQTEHYPAATLFYERRKPVCKVLYGNC
jgi:hypothetical protein